MKRSLYVILFLALAACAEENPFAMESREFNGEVCPDCPVVHISIPLATDGGALAKAVNTSLREEIIDLLDYDEEGDATDIPGAIAAFQAGYRNLQEDFPEELSGWEARVEAHVSNEGPRVLSLRMQSYIFTGGAHGYGGTRLLNFDRKTGKTLQAAQLFADTLAFRDFAEKAFRQQYHIPENDPINSTGFMFPEGRFELPENIGFTVEGLVLHYNPYEAASYADGDLVLTFPMEAVRPFLKEEFRETIPPAP
jgi:hypothetical protein